jgi:hypothetical protein
VVKLPDGSLSTNVEYGFVHDWVQEACYNMIPTDELPETHLKIGRNLREYSIENDEVYFEICNHIGAGQTLLLQDDERLDMAMVNLFAAQKAMTRAAYDHALQYGLAARHLSKGLEIDAKLKLDMDQVLVQALFSLGMYVDALQEIDKIMDSTEDKLVHIVMGVEKVRTLRILGRNRDAYQCGWNIIRSVGLRVPDDIFDPDELMMITMEYKEMLDTEETIRV